MNENQKPEIKHTTREQWLLAAVELIRPHFKAKDYEIPRVRVSCGWPSKSPLSSKKRALGECWSAEADAEGITQVFVSPYLDEVSRVVDVLVHELVHATVGCKEKHNKVFRKCALAVGLEGKMTATVAGEELLEIIGEWVKELGGYPNAKLDLTKAPTKKQGTRMIKAECGKCGYVLRTTRKWLEEVGPPLCACNHEPMGYKLPDPADSDADEGGDDDGGEE